MPEPFEPDGGQDSEPPNVGLSLLVATHLLLDLRDYLEGHQPLLRRADPRDDLLLRIAAVVSVLRAAREVWDANDH